MLEINIPGDRTLHIQHLVLDYNGTLACDGKLLPGVKSRLEILSEQLQIHVLTADTFGNVEPELAAVPCTLSILKTHHQDIGKRNYIETLGLSGTICIGNGRNDRLMMEACALGIAVMQEEGTARPTIMAADLICPSITAALDLFIYPLRLIATLRS